MCVSLKRPTTFPVYVIAGVWEKTQTLHKIVAVFAIVHLGLYVCIPVAVRLYVYV